jgi:hypothetical protein
VRRLLRRAVAKPATYTDPGGLKSKQSIAVTFTSDASLALDAYIEIETFMKQRYPTAKALSVTLES